MWIAPSYRRHPSLRVRNACWPSPSGLKRGRNWYRRKQQGRISIRVEVNEDKLIRALIHDGFLRQFQALDRDRAAIERAAGRTIDLWAAYLKTD
jgi:hypothetical protein